MRQVCFSFNSDSTNPIRSPGMNIADQIPVPYKKWLILYIDSTNHSDLYFFYKTVKEGTNFGDFICRLDAAGGLILSGKENEALLLLTASGKSWSWLCEKFQIHPRLGMRLCKIKYYNQFK
ncbi:hypothetical protein D770_16180 [Flammeovirgaceae bacterium 311]|nr:hypothetical protein D770_16180 [Flammeovirgaceae bacterium 311]